MMEPLQHSLPAPPTSVSPERWGKGVSFAVEGDEDRSWRFGAIRRQALPALIRLGDASSPTLQERNVLTASAWGHPQDTFGREGFAWAG